MLAIMSPRATAADVDNVIRLLDSMGTKSCVLKSHDRPIVEVLGADVRFDRAALRSAPMVDQILDKAEPILARRRHPDEGTLEVPLGSACTVGGKKLGLIAGPCSVESESELLDVAHAVKETGANGLRGGAFKPRTSPYSFQGHGEAGLQMLARAREATGLAIVTEVMACEQVELVAEYADVLQVGSRNMHNFNLLAKLGTQSKPVLLKRGASATLEEFILAAEYIMQGGNPNVILCERGIRTHEDYVRNTLALGVVPAVKHESRLPIVVDPSHGTGVRRFVAPMSKAGVAAGADGLLIEVHKNPDLAWTDGKQSITIEEFRKLVGELRPIIEACGREL